LIQSKRNGIEAYLTDVLSYLDFPERHRSNLHSINPLERLNMEVKRRASRWHRPVCGFDPPAHWCGAAGTERRMPAPAP